MIAQNDQFPLAEIIASIEPMARHLWRFWRTRQHVFDLDDLRQSGLVGVIEASRVFEANRGVPLARYTKRAAWGEMIHLIAQASILSGREIRRGHGFCRADHLSQDLAEPIQQTQEPRSVEKHLSCLKPDQRTLVELHVGIGGVALEFHEIATDLKISPHAVQNRFHRAIVRMRKAAKESSCPLPPKKS